LSGFFGAGETPFPQLESPLGQGKALKACRAVVLASCARAIPAPIPSTDIESKIANGRCIDMSTSFRSLKLDIIEAVAAVASGTTTDIKSQRDLRAPPLFTEFPFDASN